MSAAIERVLPTDGTIQPAFGSPCQIFSKDRVELVSAPVKITCSFNVNQHISNLTVYFKEVTGTLPDKTELWKFSKMSFPAGTVMNIEKVEKANLVSQGFWKQKFAEKLKLDDKFHPWSLNVSFEKAHASFEGIMIEKAGNLAKLRDHIHGHAGKSVEITLVIRGTDKMQEGCENLNAQFQLDTVTDPLKIWYPNTERYNVQYGSVIEPKQQPTYVLPTSYSFFPHGAGLVSDYLTRMAFGAYQDHEYVLGLLGGKKFHSREFVLVKSVGMADRSFFMFIAPEYDGAARFQPGDALSVMFGATQETEDSSKEWSATVQDPLPFSPAGFTTAIVNRPWNAQEQAYVDQDIADQALSFTKQGNLSDARDAIKKATLITAKMRYVPSEDMFKRVIAAIDRLFKLHQRHKTTEEEFSPSPVQITDMQLFLNNAPMSLPKVDFYQALNTTDIEEEHLNLDPQQLEAIKSLRHITGGWALVEGPPGTGKTHFLIQACIPFFRHEYHWPILCLSATNAGVDDIAIKANDQLVGMGSKEFVIRLHAITTESEATLAAAKKGRTIPENAKPRIFQDLTNDEEGLVDTVESIRIMYARMVQKVNQLHEGVHDKRFVVMKLSLGYRVLQVLGHAPGGEDILPGSGKEYSDLSSAFETYVHDEEVSKEDMIALRKMLKELQIALIQSAAMVVATISSASSAILYSSMDPEVIFVDEAARASEPEMLALSAHFPEVTAKCLIGDTHQLRPVAYSSTLREDQPGHCFSNQLTVSLMHRLQNSGFPVVSLKTQYRAIPRISAAYNAVIYHRQLANHESTENRPIVTKLCDFNSRECHKKTPIIFVDLPKGAALSSPTKSQYNVVNCAFVLDLVTKLFQEPWMKNNETGSKPTVAILVCYQAQYLLYSAFKENLAGQKVEWIDQLDVDKIDRRQGQEWDVVIVDLTVTDRIGFLIDPNRLNVLFSRARSGLYVVGSKEAMDLHQYKGRVPFLKNFYLQYLPYRQQMHTDSKTSKYLDFSTVELSVSDVQESSDANMHGSAQPDQFGWGDTPPLAPVPDTTSSVNAAVHGEAAGDWGIALDEAAPTKSNAAQDAWDATDSGSSNVAAGATSREENDDDMYGPMAPTANAIDLADAPQDPCSNAPAADDEQFEDMNMKDDGFEHGNQSEHEVSEREEGDDQDNNYDDAMGG